MSPDKKNSKINYMNVYPFSQTYKKLLILSSREFPLTSIHSLTIAQNAITSVNKHIGEELFLFYSYHILHRCRLQVSWIWGIPKQT